MITSNPKNGKTETKANKKCYITYIHILTKIRQSGHKLPYGLLENQLSDKKQLFSFLLLLVFSISFQLIVDKK